MVSHRNSPFHVIQIWTGSHLERRHLVDTGLVVHFGHGGDACPKAAVEPTSITVVHTTGIQQCRISFCECRNPESRERVSNAIQLWSNGLYPATFKRTRTVFSRQLLRQYRHLNLQSKITAHDFFSALRRLTNNAFPMEVKNRYREFMAAYRQYLYLCTLRWSNCRADRIHEPHSLVVRCPACPQPNINMDPEWKNCSKDMQ